MNKQTIRRWLIAGCMTLVTVLNAQTTKRPIADFLSVQGQVSTVIKPVPDYEGWIQGLCLSGGLSCLSNPPSYPGLCFGDAVGVDYAGLADRFITQHGGQSSGTAIDGDLLERPLPGGKVEISVTLHTRNALTFVVAPSDMIPGAACGASVHFDSGTLLLGERANIIPPLADRALGESFFHVSFVNPAGGALPDVIDLFGPRYSDIVEYSFNAVASGPLRPAFGAPAGARGTVTVVQAGDVRRSNIQPAIVSLRQTGE